MKKQTIAFLDGREVARYPDVLLVAAGADFYVGQTRHVVVGSTRLTREDEDRDSMMVQLRLPDRPECQEDGS